MTLQFLTHSIPDIIFTLYLLVYFPADSIWRGLSKTPPKPKLPNLQSYWRQGRFVLVLLAAFMLVKWSGNHSASQLGLDIPLSPGGTWGLVIVTVFMAVMHVLGKRAESKMTPEDRLKQEDKLRELQISMPQTRIEIAAYFVTMVGMTATWELLFRGYLLLVLTPLTGLPLAVALAAISYGAGHGFKNFKQFFTSIVVAFAFTIGYALTGSLWWLMVLHAAVPITMFYTARKLGPSEQKHFQLSP
ncbi:MULTISPECIES: CPBP family intramembrane glutamic endopeptidase [unclassified Duganella]|uniref:CPBP family intramembrane glutamic endopeptidase n=1 Tax=unclassified Duganella TaxID=2636909 RepID=UPI001314A1A6|nr:MULTISPECIES: CPBP family intramembrane glutamic endopeptidase [unclassified Duganella]